MAPSKEGGDFQNQACQLYSSFWANLFIFVSDFLQTVYIGESSVSQRVIDLRDERWTKWKRPGARRALEEM